MAVIQEAQEASFGADLEGDALDELCVKTIRFLAVDAVEKANSGHPGMPMGMADAAYVLWTEFLRLDPSDPAWPGRDRFVLSAGHGSMLLYSLLHLSGFDLPLEQLQAFRQWGSLTPGHPENHHTAGVETTTGPLGQGFGNAVGMALTRAHLNAVYGNDAVNHRIFGICSDGDLMEGVASEAASLAGHLGLGHLQLLWDDNRITIDGSTDLAFTEDVALRFEAYGWQVMRGVDGHDRAAVRQALMESVAEAERPSLICCRTHIGFGAPTKEDSEKCHGAALGAEEVRGAKERAGWPLSPAFFIPHVVKQRFAVRRAEWGSTRRTWDEQYRAWAEILPGKADELGARLSRALPLNLDAVTPPFEPGTAMATRKASGVCIQKLAAAIPALIGGSADLAESNLTEIKGGGSVARGAHGRRNIHFGVREHAMGSLLNGMTLHGGVIGFGGTFLIFSDYLRPTLRLAALMGVPTIFVFTHDSVFLGEDGPTHQPIEHLAALRAIPNLVTIRPADANEVREAWVAALRRAHGPTALILTRQNLPVFERAPGKDGGAARGAYVLFDGGGDLELILMASGSEVHVALDAARTLAAEGRGVRVVSFPSWELFDAQDEAYKKAVLPPDVVGRMVVEAARAQGWERYAGQLGLLVGLDRFGASAPAKVIAKELGFTPEAVSATARDYLSRLPERAAALRDALERL